MVGVAGKSKGCTTCRRRKVKCDEAKPKCERCQKAKLDCEGYDKFPVFIHRDQHGYKKRRRLEEVKPSTSAVVQDVVQVPQKVLLSLSSPDDDLASPDIEASQVIAWFWQSFSRGTPSRYALLSASRWLDFFIDCDTRHTALRKCLLAVAVTGWSRREHREDMLKQGRHMYTTSLNMTRKALYDPNAVMQVETLATTCVMVLYELFDSTSDNLDGWLEHLTGLSQLIRYRGPKAHNSPAARAIFEHSRYLLMLQHLLARKTCVFGEQAWIEEPWKGIHKSVEQQVFDYGCQLAGIFESCDALLREELGAVDPLNLFTRSTNVYDGVKGLIDEHIAPAVATDIAALASKEPQELPTNNPAILVLHITALGIQLGACRSACDVLFWIGTVGLETSDMNSKEAQAMANRSRVLLNERRVLAMRIMNSVRFCFKERVGFVGAARMLFALRQAMQQFTDSETEYQECIFMLEQLSKYGDRFRPRTDDNISIIQQRSFGPDQGLVRDNNASIMAQWRRFLQEYASDEYLTKLTKQMAGDRPYPPIIPSSVAEMLLANRHEQNFSLTQKCFTSLSLEQDQLETGTWRSQNQIMPEGPPVGNDVT